MSARQNAFLAYVSTIASDPKIRRALRAPATMPAAILACVGEDIKDAGVQVFKNLAVNALNGAAAISKEALGGGPFAGALDPFFVEVGRAISSIGKKR